MAEPLNILITGGHGQVGQALALAPWPQGVRLHRPTRRVLDLTDPLALAQAFERDRFDAVINAAAFTAVDAAEDQVGEAFLANALIPARLADAARQAATPLIHLSSDCVFDGRLDRPYVEDDRTAPISVYGASKRAGELAVLAGHPGACVVRTAWVVSARGSNFVRRILEVARHQPRIEVVADRVGSPTSADALARALVTLTLRLIADPTAPTGLFHCVNAGHASWAALASEAIRLAGQSAVVVPVASADRNEAAARPANSRLSCDRLERRHAIALGPWREALVPIVAELIGQRTAS